MGNAPSILLPCAFQAALAPTQETLGLWALTGVRPAKRQWGATLSPTLAQKLMGQSPALAGQDSCPGQAKLQVSLRGRGGCGRGNVDMGL